MCLLHCHACLTSIWTYMGDSPKLHQAHLEKVKLPAEPMSCRYWEALNYYGSFKVQIIPFVARIMYSNPFTTADPGTINISLYLMLLIDSILGKMVRQKTPLNEISHTILSSCIAMLLSHGSPPPFQKHFSTGRSLKRQRRGGKRDGGEVRARVERSESYSGPAPASPLHWGLICLARCLCTLLLLMTFWCHGVTVKWLPSHVAARGSATSGTMRSRWVGAGTQEAPAGCNALTLPPSPAPMKSGISRSVADDKSVSVCPGLFPGPGEDPGWGETQAPAARGQQLARVTGGNLYVQIWPLTPWGDQTLPWPPWHCGTVVAVCLLEGGRLVQCSRRPSHRLLSPADDEYVGSVRIVQLQICHGWQSVFPKGKIPTSIESCRFFFFF